MKSNLCLGMTYYEFQTSITFNGRASAKAKAAPNVVRATAYVTRIDPSLAPFVIGSITNDKDPNDLNSGIYAKRKAVKLDQSVAQLKNARFLDPPNNILKSLEPVWISNGTFFDTHATSTVRVLAPVVHRKQAIVDVPTYINSEKSQRYYTHQTNEEPYSQVYYGRKTARESVFDLAGVEQELLGGAGHIISDYQPNYYYRFDNAYRKEYPQGDGFYFGDGFTFGATFSSGPIVAKCSQSSPIHYVIYIRGPGGLALSWQEVTNYLLNEFKNDLQAERKATDPIIKEACIFDGGSSQQLWVRNQRQQMRFSGVKVPNYLCVWGI